MKNRAAGLVANVLSWTSLAFFVLLLIVQFWFACNIFWLKYVPPDSTAFMRQRLAVLRMTEPRAALRYTWKDYSDISANLKKALIASEDAKFVDHEGFDWDGIDAAREKNEAQGKAVAGGSTITQQLAKNLFLTPDKTWLRKGQEAVITLMLESILDKERILEIYLNVIEWGDGIFGADAAAQTYFNIPAAQLSAAQAARLAAMAPNPRYYQKNPRAPGLRKKTAIVLQRMGGAALPD